MSTLIIILGIIVLLVAYYVYIIVTADPIAVKNVDLTQTPPVISPTSINDPYSLNYTVGTWVYISNYSPQIGRFLMYGDKVYSNEKSIFSLRMDPTGNNVYADVLVNSSSALASATVAASSISPNTKLEGVYANGTISTPIVLPVLLTTAQSAFPLQKWVYVVVSVSNNFIEAYINGKFITAVNINNNSSYGINGVYHVNAPQDPNAGATFTFGAKGTTMDNGTIRQNGCPVVLSNVTRWNIPLTSGEVYNNYLKGNGQQTSLFGPSYHLSVTLSKDSNTYSLPVF
jgi:hypothetical protein